MAGGYDLGGGNAGGGYDLGQGKAKSGYDLGGAIVKGVESGASALGNALDYQRAGLQEHIFHQGSSDKNREKLRESLGLNAAYHTLPGPIRGAIDLGLDTITDPLTYETLGAGPLVKGLGLGAKLTGAIGKVPLGAAIQDATMWGAKVGRKYGPEARDVARGAANLGSAEGVRTESALNRMVDQAFKGLNDDEVAQVGRALNGEIPMESLPKKLQRPATQVRRITELDFSLRSAARGEIAGLARKAEEPTLFRYQRTPGSPEVGGLRGGTFYATDKSLAEQYNQIGRGHGGTNKIERVVNPNAKVFNLGEEGTDWLGYRAFNRSGELLPQKGALERGRRIDRNINWRSLEKNEQNAARYLRAIGVPENEISRIVKKGGGTLAIDRMAAEIAKKKGFNAIKSGKEFMDLGGGTLEPRAADPMLRYRENYLPGIHEAEAVAPDRPAGVMRKLEPFDPRTLERDEFKVENAAQVRAGLQGMAKNTGRQVGAAKIRDALGDLFDKPEIHDLFNVKLGATGEERSAWEKVKEGFKEAVGFPRAAIVSMSPRHGVNILGLLANTDPGALPEAMNLARKLATASPKEYFQLTKEGRELGALSAEFMERKPFFSHIPGLSKYTGAMNKLTWAIDDAAKQTYAKRIAKNAAVGANPLASGGRAARELVDYANISPLTEKARYVAPFATFRTSIPGAVMGGVLRNPARAAFLNRATGNTFYGGKPDKGQHGVELYNPTADIGRAFNPGGIGDYLRGSAGAPTQAIAGLAQDIAAPGSHPTRWAMHGQSWLPKYDKNGKLDLGFVIDSAVAGIPEAQTLLEAFGIGRFQFKGAGQEAVRQSLGVDVK